METLRYNGNVNLESPNEINLSVKEGDININTYDGKLYYNGNPVVTIKEVTEDEYFELELSNSIEKEVIYKITGGEAPTLYESEYVDLGLPSGTLWAKKNIGAFSPEDVGNYYSWGETVGYNEGKTDFSWDNYKWSKGTYRSLTKYCNSSYYGYNGFKDDLTELELEDDAAYVNSGAIFKTASNELVTELINPDYTTYDEFVYNNVTGILITRISNGNSIFIPNSGYYVREELKYTQRVCFLENSIATGSYSSAALLFNARRIGDNYKATASYAINYDSRSYGVPIRPVFNPENYIYYYFNTQRFDNLSGIIPNIINNINIIAENYIRDVQLNSTSIVSAKIAKFDYIKSIEYSELRDLYDNKQLVPGLKYRLTDYKPVANGENIRISDPDFDLILTATSNDEFSIIADIIHKENKEKLGIAYYDIENNYLRYGWVNKYSFNVYETIDDEIEITKLYLGNEIESQQVYIYESGTTTSVTTYCIKVYSDESCETFYGYVSNMLFTHDNWKDFKPSYLFLKSSSNNLYYNYNYVNPDMTVDEKFIEGEGTGVIYRILDNKNNDFPYDFMNISFYESSDKHDNYYSYSYNNKIEPYMNENRLYLNNIMVVNNRGCDFNGNYFGKNCHDIKLYNGSVNNNFNNCNNITSENSIEYSNFYNAYDLNIITSTENEENTASTESTSDSTIKNLHVYQGVTGTLDLSLIITENLDLIEVKPSNKIEILLPNESE